MIISKKEVKTFSVWVDGTDEDKQDAIVRIMSLQTKHKYKSYKAFIKEIKKVKSIVGKN